MPTSHTRLLQLVIDEVDLALIVWNPKTAAITLTNRRAAQLVDGAGRVKSAIRDAARLDRRLRKSTASWGVTAPPQPATLDGASWRVATRTLPGSRELIQCRRARRSDADLLDRLGEAWALTRRQRDVLRLMVAGSRPIDIAAELSIQRTTVYRHQTRICEAARVPTVRALLATVDRLRRG